MHIERNRDNFRIAIPTRAFPRLISQSQSKFLDLWIAQRALLFIPGRWSSRWWGGLRPPSSAGVGFSAGKPPGRCPAPPRSRHRHPQPPPGTEGSSKTYLWKTERFDMLGEDGHYRPPMKWLEGNAFTYFCLFTGVSCDHYPWCIGRHCTCPPTSVQDLSP